MQIILSQLVGWLVAAVAALFWYFSRSTATTKDTATRVLSRKSRRLAEKLRLSADMRGHVVTVAIDDLVVTRRKEATPISASSFDFNPKAMETIHCLLEVADVIVMLPVKDVAEKTALCDAMALSGLTSSPLGGPSIAPHKVVFFTTEVGKVAIVRQLRPSLHIDTSATTVTSLTRHVPELVLLSTSRPRTRGDLSIQPPDWLFEDLDEGGSQNRHYPLGKGT